MMAQPETLDSTGIHAAKLEFLKSIKPISKNDVSSQAVRAQYDNYRQSVGNTKSNVETYAKLQLQSTAEQWQGTDIILETGKGLDEKSTHIEVTFKPYAEDANPNTLIFRLAPTEGITLQLQAKYPGLTDATETVAMEFDYEKAFNDSTAEAYERVIADAFRGDQTLFASSEEVMVSWKIVQNVINAWSKDCDGLRFYGLGSSAQEIL
jgi:glucose-6-phosphate 1-dehydrogenase